MTLDLHPEAVRQGVERLFEDRVIEREQLAAVVTDEVVVVISGVFEPLEARLA